MFFEAISATQRAQKNMLECATILLTVWCIKLPLFSLWDTVGPQAVVALQSIICCTFYTFSTLNIVSKPAGP